jgi:uncharacterized protein (DUF934 family)
MSAAAPRTETAPPKASVASPENTPTAACIVGESGAQGSAGAVPTRRLMRGRELVTDDWRSIDEDPNGVGLALILPLTRWQAERDRWWLWAGRLGVKIAPADRIETLVPDLKRLSLVAIEFPGPSEGRGYSQARLLRERFGFTGEIRAVGYVKRDQIFFLARCGFDAFELSPGVDPAGALAAFEDFKVAYQQAAADQLLSLKHRA